MNLSEMKLGDRVTIKAVEYTACKDCALIASCNCDIKCPEDLMFAIVPQPEQSQEPTPHWSEKFKAAERAGKRVEWHSSFHGWDWVKSLRYPNGMNDGHMWCYDYFGAKESDFRIVEDQPAVAPKYRPLNAQEMRELVGKIICCDNNIYNVLAFSEIDDQLTVGIIGDIWITNHALMDKYTYPDGKPVAVEVTA